MVWGARTLRGSTTLADEYKYVPVRRLALFLEETPVPRHPVGGVRAERRAAVGADPRRRSARSCRTCSGRARSRASTPREAYFVKCDAETTTQNDIDLGIVNILVGFAPLKPAEFVVISIQQMTASASA